MKDMGGSHFDDNTIDNRGVTTLPIMLGKESGNCEVPIETESDSNFEKQLVVNLKYM